MKKLTILLTGLLTCTLTISQTYSSEVSNKGRFEKVLEQLNLTDSVYLEKFFVEKQLPYYKNVFAMIVPTVVLVENEDEWYYALELNSYILLVDSAGNIMNRYYEPKAWTSDAFALESIEIDTSSYYLNDNTIAFGVRVRHEASSSAVPYTETTISLFIPRGDSLVQVLRNFTIADQNGEWDLDCEGQFFSKEGILTMSKDKTNGFNDIIVNYKYSTEIDTEIDGDCISEENSTYGSETLQFIDGMYKSNKKK